jgi:hypothetical protein
MQTSVHTSKGTVRRSSNKPFVKKKVSPWVRWQLIVTIVEGDRTLAAKKLKITKSTLNINLASACRSLGVPNINQAALRLGIIKFNYDEIGTWIDKKTIELGPGVELDLEGEIND